MDQLQQNNIQNSDDKSALKIYHTVLRDFLPFWPVYAFFILLFLFLGNLKINYTQSIFETETGLLLKDESNTSSDQILQQVAGKSPTFIDDEIGVIKGFQVIKGAVEKCGYFFTIKSEGVMKKVNIPLEGLPFYIDVINKDKISNSKFAFKLLNDGRLRVKGKLVKYEVITEIDGNKLIFRRNYNFKKGDKIVDEFLKMQFKNNNWIEILDNRKAAKQFLENVRIEKDKRSSIIHLFAESVSPRYSEKMLNSLVESYQSYTQSEKRKKAKFTVEFIDRRLDFLGRDLDTIERRIEVFKSTNDISRLSKESEYFLDKMRLSDNKIWEFEFEIIVLKQIKSYILRGVASDQIAPGLTGLSEGNMRQIQPYFDRFNELKLNYNKLNSLVGNKNNQLGVVKSELNLVRTAIDNLIDNSLENLYKIKEGILQDRSGTNTNYNKLIRSIPEKERTLLNLTRQQNVLNSLYQYLLQKREESAIQMAGTLSNVRILENTTGEKQVVPQVKLTQILFTFIGFLLVTIILVVKSILRNKVYNVGELREVLNIPILGSIIYTETSDKSSLVIEQDNSRNIVAEQFRSIRTNIGFITEESINTKVILITSSISTEGKSFCSLNLGAVYAISGKKTLVIEGDLRKPGISRNFNISKREIGLSNLLSNSQITVDQVIKDVGYENLSIISSGPIPPNPLELLASDRMLEVMDDLKSKFDIIIFDCPPIGLVSDSLEVSRFADLSIFVVRFGVSELNKVKEIALTFKKLSKSNNIACLLNGVKGGIAGYGYGYDYGYGNLKAYSNYSGAYYTLGNYYFHDYGAYNYNYDSKYLAYNSNGSDNNKNPTVINKTLSFLVHIVVMPFRAFFTFK